MDIEVLPTGTATNWRHLSSDEESVHTYIYDGPVTSVQGPEYLAEQLRQDGAASSLGAALSMSENAELSLGWLYTDEYSDDEHILDHIDPWLDAPTQVVIAKVKNND